jgi:hypothetical protein
MKQNKTKLIETNKVLSPLPKKIKSSNVWQLVTFQNTLGSSIGLTSWQYSIGDMELATWQCVWLTIW